MNQLHLKHPTPLMIFLDLEKKLFDLSNFKKIIMNLGILLSHKKPLFN